MGHFGGWPTGHCKCRADGLVRGFAVTKTKLEDHVRAESEVSSLDAVILFAEDMAGLNDRDRRLVSEEITTKVTAAFANDPAVSEKISAAIESFKPKGWRRASANILAVGSPITIIGVIVASIVFALSQHSVATTRLAEEKSFETHTGDRLDAIEKGLVAMRSLVAANQPGHKQNQDAAKELVAQARQGIVPPIPEQIVAQTCESFIRVSPKDKGAWETGLELVAYRSLLNSSQKPKVQTEPYNPQEAGHRAYSWTYIDGKQHASLFVFGIAPLDAAARMESLVPRPGEPGDRYGHGSASLELRGGATNIDGAFWRHVIADGVEIHYSGENVILEDVMFVNCTFVFVG